MNSLEVRQKFFDFFKKRSHETVASSSLIPAQDPTLLFANAGMNQFKDVFLGKEKRSYTRAVSIQKCVRAGGKHNDLDNVGFTKRHLTFFEMMGNFSFGDYFKKEAIEFAWEFITKEVKLPTNNLYATVFTTDDESYDIWHKHIGIPKERIARLGAQENFWQMGDVGPCGPCTEIHIDRGPEFGCKNLASCGPACDCDRFLEIWNLVFMQFDRQQDGTDKLLKQTGVDTGMGLERLCSVLQAKDSVFEIDLFAGIMKKIEEETGITYATADAQTKAAFNVLADHIRSSSFIIADGCAPSNEGRGYVLRKIIRRAALFAQKLNAPDIFPVLSQQLAKDMGEIYPELKTNKKIIFDVLTSEIKKFAASLVRGQAVLDKYMRENSASKIISGEQAFKLYDTYGFPLELLHVIAKENNFSIDTKGFETLMLKQQEQSGKKTTDALATLELDESISTAFTGYKELETPSEISALIVETTAVDTVPANTLCWVIAKQSPFFIVGGGQVPDKGWITIKEKQVAIEDVRFIGKAIAALIHTPTSITVGDTITSTVNKDLRTNAMKNHTATHLLQAALMELFGKQIKQSGSLVHPDYLRFDFTYHEQLTQDDITKIENLVNQKIRENIPVSVNQMHLKQALEKGALAFFGDKYNPEQVRVVEVPNFSVELCGGTHVNATGDIGVFKITESTSLAAGHRRIVAVTGPVAVSLFQETFNTVKTLSTEFKVKREEVVNAVYKLKEDLKTAQTHLAKVQKQALLAQLPLFEQNIQLVGSIPFLMLTLEDLDQTAMKELTTTLQSKKPGFYVIVSRQPHTISFFAQVNPAYTNGVNLKKFATWLQENYGIKSGGNQTQVQGGMTKFDPKLRDAVKQWLQQEQN